MKHTLLIPAVAVVLGIVALPGCLKDKVLEIVLTAETSADFATDEESASWTKAAIVDLGQEIRDILEDNGYSTSDIKSAHVTSAHYGVTSFIHEHDWEIGGRIDVEYNGTTETAILYTAQSVQAALGKKISAPIEPDAVTLMNQALQEFLSGGNPVLTFTVVNGSVTPAPTAADRIVFDWRAWIAIQVIVEEEVEVPDPF